MDREQLRALDLQHVWHPYTQMQDLAALDFPIIERAEGRKLIDVDGREYWDGVSSIWLNVHGHRVPEIDQAIRAQLDKVAHTTTLGQGNVPSILLAERLARLSGLPRVFFSGTVQLPFPDTYRGPKPDDPEATRDWALAAARNTFRTHGSNLAALIVEPMVQGVGGMRVMPPGYLTGLRQLCDEHGVLLIADEVATGFGRTGTMFACQHEGVVPDLMALGKGLTGGYMPLAATLASERIYEGFLGAHREGRQLFHGHSFTGNQLGCAAALANVDLLEPKIPEVISKAAWLDGRMQPWTDLPHVGTLTGMGFMRGVELVAGRARRTRFEPSARAGWQVYLEAKKRGMLARPYGNTALFLPPLGSTRRELEIMADIYEQALAAAMPALSSVQRTVQAIS